MRGGGVAVIEGIAKAVMEGRQVQLLMNVQTHLLKKQMDLEKELMGELLQSLGLGNNIDTLG